MRVQHFWYLNYTLILPKQLTDCVNAKAVNMNIDNVMFEKYRLINHPLKKINSRSTNLSTTHECENVTDDFIFIDFFK